MQASDGAPVECFTDWVAPHLMDMRRFAISLAGPDGADDLLQDTLGRAWDKRGQFDPQRGTPRAWLFAIMADRARRIRRLTPRPLELRLSADPLTGGADVIGIDVRRAVAALPRRQRVAVTLHYYLDLPIAEVAQLMGCSTGTVKSTLHDARLGLADRLGGAYA
jgi:RNA polymerase sigma-70 factor (ECF subfamily)